MDGRADDLGRRPRGDWVSVALNCVNRQELKERRCDFGRSVIYATQLTQPSVCAKQAFRFASGNSCIAAETSGSQSLKRRD